MDKRANYIPKDVCMARLYRMLCDERDAIELITAEEKQLRKEGALRLISRILKLKYFKGLPAYDPYNVGYLVDVLPDEIKRAENEFKSAESRHNDLHTRLRELREGLDAQERILRQIEDDGTKDTDDYNKYEDVSETVKEYKAELRELESQIFADDVDYNSAKEMYDALRGLLGFVMNKMYFRTLKMD